MKKSANEVNKTNNGNNHNDIVAPLRTKKFIAKLAKTFYFLFESAKSRLICTWYKYLWRMGICPLFHALPWEPVSLHMSTSASLSWLFRYKFSLPIVLPSMWYQKVKQFLVGIVGRVIRRPTSPFCRGNEDSTNINFSAVSESIDISCYNFEHFPLK